MKDTIVRYKAMKGFYAPFIPGYDTHGMPTEKKAIEKLGLDRSKIPVTKFRDTCREFTTNYKDIQTEGFKRLGVLMTMQQKQDKLVYSEICTKKDISIKD